MATRTQKRSHSGAQTPCPHCGKKLSGAKGLAMHIADAHPPVDAGHPYGVEHPMPAPASQEA